MKTVTIRLKEKDLKKLKAMSKSKTNQGAFEWLIEAAIKADRQRQNRELKERIKRITIKQELKNS